MVLFVSQRCVLQNDAVFTEGFKKWCCFFTEGFMFLFVDLFCRELVVLNSGVLLSAISQRALGREIVNDFAAFRLLEV